MGVTQTRELKPNGSNILVTEENKKEYVKLVCQEKMTGAIRKQVLTLDDVYKILNLPNVSPVPISSYNSIYIYRNVLKEDKIRYAVLLLIVKF